jgi:hypothetical protein
MIRTLLLGACLALCCGCSSASKTKVTDGKVEQVADSPKQYEYRDMSRGSSSAFARRSVGSPTLIR